MNTVIANTRPRFAGEVKCFMEGRADDLAYQSYQRYRNGGRSFIRQLKKLGIDRMENVSLATTASGKREYKKINWDKYPIITVLKGAFDVFIHPFESWGRAEEWVAVYNNGVAKGQPVTIVRRPLKIRSTGTLTSTRDYLYESLGQRLSRFFLRGKDAFLSTIRDVAQAVHQNKPVTGQKLANGIEILTPLDGKVFSERAGSLVELG